VYRTVFYLFAPAVLTIYAAVLMIIIWLNSGDLCMNVAMFCYVT